MGPCVYATQHRIWLQAASECERGKAVCFRSNRTWATAAKLLDLHGTLPILFREQENETGNLACTYLGELIEVVYPSAIGDVVAQTAWLKDRLWLQREAIQGLKRSDKHPTWELQFQEWELDTSLKAKTLYSLRNVQQVEPILLPNLLKLDDDHPLSPNYVRGYALCHYPEASIKLKTRLPTIFL